IPAALARLPSQRTVDAMLELVIADETDQQLDHRVIRTLSKLRVRQPGLLFDASRVDAIARASCDAAARYAAARPAVQAVAAAGNAVAVLLLRALDEAWQERHEDLFRVLGLIHPPADVHRAHDAIVRGGTHERANAREWLEQ